MQMGQSSDFLIDGPAPRAGRPLLVLAHGAGAPMDSTFMATIAAAVGDAGITVVRFEFPYMAERRETGRKRPPDRAPRLLEAFRDVLAGLPRARPLVVGGKSLGGRMASMLAAGGDIDVDGVLCLGYPFHAPGRTEPRIDHFGTIRCPVLIVQGTRDPFGRLDEVKGYRLGAGVQLHWLEDGDHDFKPRKASGIAHNDHLAAAAARAVGFIRGLR